jgi:methionyl-tRNA formyltransferase
MKFIFFGTPSVATIVLDTLKTRGLLPTLIVTAPDRPSGRGLRIEESPVSAWANTNNIAVIKPESLKDESVAGAIGETNSDVAIVFAYGKIIPQTVLDLPRKGMLNIHPSLLPLHRGPAPVEGAILHGDTETGVTIMQLDNLMDHGPIIAQEKIAVGPDVTTPQLLEKLVKIGSEKLADILGDYIDGKITPIEQQHDNATYTQKITKADGEISINGKPEELYRKYRAYAGWPGVFYFQIDGDKRIRTAIKKARMEDGHFVIERIVEEGKKEKPFIS